MAPRKKGIVKWFSDSKGYGFIGREGSPDIYVNHNSVRAESNPSRTLNEGDRVEFDEAPRAKGLQAADVVRVN